MLIRSSVSRFWLSSVERRIGRLRVCCSTSWALINKLHPERHLSEISRNFSH